jgi:KaiC/GvpD/RAD55 family RecA-like ATPase
VGLGGGGEERDGIPEGEHDEYLHKLASWHRGRYGLNAEAIARVLSEGPAAVLLGGRPEDPYTPKDFERIAKSVAKYEAEIDADLLNPSGWRSAADLEFAGPPREWWVHGFVPKGELVMVYGPGAAGKSTWGSWLASQCTRRGGRFAFVGVEEPFERFAWRALLTGATAELLHEVPTAGSLSFPKHIKALSEAVEALDVDLVYFDSIYAHFDDLGGLNAAERARKCLSPLAEMAQKLSITVVGVFHENKLGQYLGSTEMRNVGRVMLHATREDGGPMRLSVSKTNFRKPTHSLTFWGRDVALSDPSSGEVQLEVNERGEVVPEIITIVGKVEKVGAPLTHVDVDELETPAIEKVHGLLLEQPNLSYGEIAKILDLPIGTVRAYGTNFRAALNAIYKPQ